MSASGHERIRFEQCVIAAGSEPVRLPLLPHDPRIIDSTDALELPEFSGGLLVIGGGIIGLEMACVFDALGSQGERCRAHPTADAGLRSRPGAAARAAHPRALPADPARARRVTAVEPQAAGLKVSFAGDHGDRSTQLFEHVLVAVGRIPNGRQIGAEPPASR